VYSYFPSSPLGTQTQRQRWETGHLNLISTASKYLFSPAFLLRPRAFLFALDLTIPPLTLLFLVLVAYMAIAAITTLFLDIGLASLILALFCLSLFTLTTFCAWFAHGRSILPPRAIVKVAAYMLGKIPMYAAACFGVRETKWVRTDRSKSPD
jgi:cellulose synthase/poly-beta-1,6-N-acetylglucosamine synthase-like glycosyltransferase